MSPVGYGPGTGAPDIIRVVPGPRLRRQVWLAYRVGATAGLRALPGGKQPTWMSICKIVLCRSGASLARLRTELYRDVQGIYFGECPALEAAFDQKGPFWGRHYLFWHHGKPLTLIYEVFSPYLTRYLGPM